MNAYGQRITAPGEDFRADDRLEITDTVWRFLLAYDIGDHDMFESCFTDPVHWDLSNNVVPFTGGPADKAPTVLPRSEFVTTALETGPNSASREHFVQHCVNNPIITFTGDDSATVLTHLRDAIHVRTTNEQGEQEPQDQVLGGLYHIDALRQAGRWRLSALRLTVYTI